MITNFRTADLNNSTGQVYGVEFSNGGNKLFATLRGAASQVIEFAFDSLAIPYLKQPPIPPVAEELGAIQRGPDGQLYVAVNGQSFLGTIQATEDTTQVSTFMVNGFGLLGGTNSNLGLPNFIQNLADPIQGPGISIAGACVQDSVQFFGTPTDPIDIFFWQVQLGGSVITSSTEQAFAFLFATPGTYDVSLRLTNRCGLDTTLVQQHVISGVPPDPTTSVVLCTGSQVLDANPSNLPGLTYLWSTGDTTRTITVNAQAIYQVQVTNVGGCTTTGSILAADNRPRVDLGANITICQNVALPPFNAQNPGATYAWTINGVAAGTAQTQSVDTSVPGTSFEYEVTITDPITSCFFRDSVILTINPSPLTSVPLTANPTTCAAADGTIDLNITGPPSALFSYFITGPSTSLSGTDLGLGAIPTATGLDAGTYGITIADQVSGCATVMTATLNDNLFTVTGVPNALCDPIGITVTTIPNLGALDYRVINSVTSAVTETGSRGGAAPTFNTNAAGLPSNADYIVEVTSAGCTTSSIPITVAQAATLPITFDLNDICNQNVTVVSAGATSFDWSMSQSGSVVPPTSNPTVSVNPGTWLLRVRVDDGAGPNCPTTDSVTVAIDPPLAPDFTQSDPCTDMVTINATPATGSYLYRWFRNGTLDLSLAGPQVLAGLANDGETYFVRVVSTVSGCQEDSPTKTVQIDGELGVTLSSSIACEGSQFTLTAVPTRASTFAWEIDGGLIPGQSNATLQDTRAGVYTVTATAATCLATTDFEVILSPITPGLLGSEAVICPDPANPDPETREVTLVPGDFVGYDWYKDGVALGITTATLVVDEPGIYSVDLLNTSGCTSTDNTEVSILCDPVIVGPNAFRPTSDVTGSGGELVNQSFKLFTFFIDDEDFQVLIFNRWGEMIYQSSQRDFKWNGGYNNNVGKLAPTGTYSYVVRYKSSYRPEKGIQEKRGGVVLLR
jgi:gliding motility-associated-like protein